LTIAGAPSSLRELVAPRQREYPWARRREARGVDDGPAARYVGAMGQPAKRRATYQDVIEAPEHMVAEIIDGELLLHPRPAKPHAAAAAALGEELGPPFKRGRGGPGGWIILWEPELHLGEDILVPDLAGWRRERMPVMTTEEPFFSLAPDWVCEVVSPGTGKLDRARKLPIYAQAGVGHAWIVDPLQRTLESLRRQGEQWLIIGTWADEARVRAEPFDAIELDLGLLWADVQLGG
jgi:Uma2 family endonuclease